MRTNTGEVTTTEGSSKRRRLITKAVIGCTAVLAATAAYMWTANESERIANRAPDMIVSGDFTDDGGAVSIQGAVNIRCIEPYSGEPYVTAESRTVTSRDNNLGRVISVHFRPDVSSCEEAVEIVENNPFEIYDHLKENVTGYTPDVAGDGNVILAETYNDVIATARENGVAEFTFHG